MELFPAKNVNIIICNNFNYFIVVPNNPNLFSLLSFTAIADGDWKVLEGIYAVTGTYTSDVDKNSHFRFQLSGQAAKDMYFAMGATAVVDECTEAESKSIGDMQCLFYKVDNLYECHFSINIAKQKIEYGVTC